jgi:hypothetical protein
MGGKRQRWEAAIRPHKYFEGQIVLVAYGNYPDIQKGERFRVARLLPLEGLAPQYRIRSEFDGHERIVREGQLSAVAPL